MNAPRPTTPHTARICGACNTEYRFCHRCDATLKGTEDPKHYPLGDKMVHLCSPCFDGLTRMGV